MKHKTIRAHQVLFEYMETGSGQPVEGPQCDTLDDDMSCEDRTVWRQWFKRLLHFIGDEADTP